MDLFWKWYHKLLLGDQIILSWLLSNRRPHSFSMHVDGTRIVQIFACSTSKFIILHTHQIDVWYPYYIVQCTRWVWCCFSFKKWNELQKSHRKKKIVPQKYSKIFGDTSHMDWLGFWKKKMKVATTLTVHSITYLYVCVVCKKRYAQHIAYNLYIRIA